jgi:hypothetical protein
MTTPDPARLHRWSHNFGRGLICTAVLEGEGLTCHWSARPPVENRGFAKAHLRWMRHLTSQAAAVLGKRIVQLIETAPGRWTTIVGEPPAGAAKNAGAV